MRGREDVEEVEEGVVVRLAGTAFRLDVTRLVLVEDGRRLNATLRSVHVEEGRGRVEELVKRGEARLGLFVVAGDDVDAIRTNR